ncbi:DUF4384 domain-containing protein [Paludibaculum fermentans]|uniref:DUF4384 domain-containing protein n=1 Tax=Paludibaculum fermentans TaxID=1473598 RepID=A0A7S7NKF8_PALFE|nr:DUF4384 domain-containing protein [Paludibaculum fermentans]QOY85280.1 DUF4384 domain-containing protein [Paludibaculum fermentans]
MRLGLVCLLGAALYGQQAPNRMEIKVELRKEGAWKIVDPSTVFDKDAQVRFRVRTNFAGWLYVMNQGTTGSYSLLFPREDTGSQNRLEPDRDYIVPAAAGAFKVTGPAGHDIVYWMVTPVEITSSESRPPASSYVPLPPPPPPGTKLNTLMPRCDDSIFKARGECIDSTAGPRKVTNVESLPDNLKDVQGLKSRELVFIKEKGGAVVSTPGNLKGPVIYEFRLSHK